MADFSAALEKTLNAEGFYANNPHDNGGETYCGIARAHHPEWEGWQAVDKFKSEHGKPKPNQEIKEANKFVEDFYRSSFWAPIHGDEIVDQNFADLIFDIAVNSGVRGSALMVQEVLRDCFAQIDVALDGKFGKRTAAALNSCVTGEKDLFGIKVPNSYVFLVQLTAVRMKRYAKLAFQGEAWAIQSWTKRAFSFLGSK